MTGSPKTRIAPTPSGFLHRGNAFNFIVTALVAHWEKADILLRIDDIDQARYRGYYADDIFRSLENLGIEWQEGPQNTTELEKNWSQHKRLDHYQQYLGELIEGDEAYACRCSRKEVEKLSIDGAYPGTCRELNFPIKSAETAIRLKTDDQILKMETWPSGSISAKLPTNMRDFVLRRKDSLPAYQLASVVDDIHFGVNIIVRGEDLYDSTLAQLFLAEKLGAESFLKTKFLHHGLIREKEGAKLSKTTGAEALGLKDKISAQEIYRQFSHWLGIEEVDSLTELKKLAKPADLNLVTQSS